MWEGDKTKLGVEFEGRDSMRGGMACLRCSSGWRSIFDSWTGLAKNGFPCGGGGGLFFKFRHCKDRILMAPVRQFHSTGNFIKTFTSFLLDFVHFINIIA